MGTSGTDIGGSGFSGPAWQRAAAALADASGVVLSAFDLTTEERLGATGMCGYCHLATGSAEPGVANCFDRAPSAKAGFQRMTCRAGLPVFISSVTHGDEVVAHLMISGVITSTRERRRVYEQLIARGVREESARQAVRSLPIISRRQAESYLELAVSAAEAVISGSGPLEGESGDATDERLLAETGYALVRADRLDAASYDLVVANAAELARARGGMLLLPRAGAYFEIAAARNIPSARVGTRLPLDQGPHAKAIASGRAVLARIPDGSMLIAPLRADSRVVGVLELAFSETDAPSAERISILERFAAVAAAALGRSAAFEDVRAEANVTRQLHGIGVDLANRLDAEMIITAALRHVAGSVTCDVAGMTVSAWGRDRADVVLCADAASFEVDALLETASGRDLAVDPFEMTRIRREPGDLVADAEASREWATLSVEIDADGLTVGTLFVASASGARFGGIERSLVSGIAEHVGAALARASLFSRIRDDYAKTIAALSASLDAAERLPQGHSARVMEYSLLIGEELGLPADDLEQLRFAGLLHDFGAGADPHDVMLKVEGLPADELAHVQAGAERTANVVQQIEFLKTLAPVVLHHHERWDGRGLPMGLSADDIPLLARIIAVADAFDTLTESDAGGAGSFKTARIELERSAGTKFDPRVVAALLEALDREALAASQGLMAGGVQEQRPELFS